MLRRYSWRGVHFPDRARSLIVVALAVSLGGLLSGCGVTRHQLEAAKTFAESTSKLADSAKSAYVQAGQDESDLRVANFIMLEGPGSDVAPITQVKYADEFLPLRASDKSMKGRLEAAGALAAYGQAITTLLDSKTQEGDFAAATDKFTASLKSIPAKNLKSVGITTAEIESLGGVLKAFGNLYLDHQRREVLERVIPAAEPVVTRLCKMFRHDFDTSATEGDSFAEVYRSSLSRILRNTRKQIGERPDSVERRAILIPIYRRVQTVDEKVSGTFGTVRDAAASCVSASEKLADAIEDPAYSIDDIIDFARKADAAYTAVTAFAPTKK